MNDLGRPTYWHQLMDEIVPSLGVHTPNYQLRTELFAGLMGAMLVIPQGITFSYLAGLPPIYGLYSAIFLTFFASLFSSCSMISGPNTAVALMIGSAVQPLAGRGSPIYIEYVILLSVMVGLFQWLFWLARTAKIFQYISPAAISGISAGAGFLIVMSSLDGMLGLSPFNTTFFFEKLFVLLCDPTGLINPYAVIVASITVITGLYYKSRIPRLYIILALCSGLVASSLITFIFPAPKIELDYLGYMAINQLSISLPNLDHNFLMSALPLIPFAFAIAFVGLAQSLVIAKSIHIKSDQLVVLNKEIFAQGTANILASAFSSFAGAGSFNRTEVNQSMGSVSNFSGLSSALFVLLLILLLEKLLAGITMATLASLLFVVGAGMIKFKEMRYYAKVKSELAIYMLTFLTIAFMGLAMGVAMAIVLSVAVFLLNITRLDVSLSETPKGKILKVRGALFYANVGHLTQYFRHHEDENITVDLEHTSYIDRSVVEFFNYEANKMTNQNRLLTLYLNNDKRHAFVAGMCGQLILSGPSAK